MHLFKERKAVRVAIVSAYKSQSQTESKKPVSEPSCIVDAMLKTVSLRIIRIIAYRTLVGPCSIVPFA